MIVTMAVEVLLMLEVTSGTILRLMVVVDGIRGAIVGTAYG